MSNNWEYEYSPFTAQDGSEIPNYVINDTSCDDPECEKVCETNENAPAELQYRRAVLISAAPELLEACKSLLHWCETMVPEPNLCADRKKAIEVINKATVKEWTNENKS